MKKEEKQPKKRRIHSDLTDEHWRSFNIFEQMANIGADVGRTINWREKDKNISKHAFERALELMDLTIEDPKNKSKLKELCRLREVMVDYFFGVNIYKSDDDFFEKYFYAFNYAARLGR